MSALAVFWLLWVLDRWEGDVAVFTSEDGRVADVARAGLPPDLRPGDALADLAGPPVRAAGGRATTIAARRARLLALARREPLRQGSPVKNRPDHRQDHFFHKAKKDGFAARSIYKLEEIDQKHRILRSGQKVLDLGCAPGSWLQYIGRVVGPNGRVVGLDLKPVKVPLPPHVRTLQADAFETPVESLLEPGQLFDVVVSDMAPSTIGNRFTDHVRSMELCHRVLAVADRSLRRGGTVVCKAFEGEDIPVLAAAFRERFSEFRRLKPKGTRTESVEVFFVGIGFTGAPVVAGDAPAPAPEPETGENG